MPDTNEQSRHQVRATTSLVASILVGLTLLIAGSGKVFGFGEMPGQTMQFLGWAIPDALLTPGVALFIGDIFLPYIIPWIELALGILLILRIWPRLIAVLCLPLTMAFMANNSWLLSQGKTKFSSCECFGIWEKLFGTLTPLQSLYIDIGLLALALTIVVVHPSGFLSSPPWLAKLRRKSRTPR
jgi:uncharacterized membrane protein YphA (DoxX/SURF4 family)